MEINDRFLTYTEQLTYTAQELPDMCWGLHRTSRSPQNIFRTCLEDLSCLEIILSIHFY